jgi:BlaI family penicillinase repressor
MPETKINITESEWKIMQVIWNEPYLTLGNIKNRLDAIIVWDRTTINTLLRRLRKKSVVGVKEMRYNKYYALVSEDECLTQEMGTILSKFFYKSPKRLMTTLVKNENFSKDDIMDIENLLKAIKDDSENAS